MFVRFSNASNKWTKTNIWNQGSAKQLNRYIDLLKRIITLGQIPAHWETLSKMAPDRSVTAIISFWWQSMKCRNTQLALKMTKFCKYQLVITKMNCCHQSQRISNQILFHMSRKANHYKKLKRHQLLQNDNFCHETKLLQTKWGWESRVKMNIQVRPQNQQTSDNREATVQTFKTKQAIASNFHKTSWQQILWKWIKWNIKNPE